MKPILFIFCFVIFFGCDYKKEKENIKTVIVYNENDYVRYYMNKKVRIIIRDTMCSYEKNRAISDIQNRKLKIYFSYLRFRKNLVPNQYFEIAKYLSKYKIAVDTILDEYSEGCFHYDNFERYCYQNIMKNEIDKKYGENFLDSLCNLVEKDYVKKNPDKIYEMTKCDLVSRYPNTKNYNDMFDKSEKDFFKQFQYPKGYKFKNEKVYSYTTATFILSKTGKISQLKTEANFENPENEKYKSYFETEVANFIKSVKFIPASSCGIIVNSEMELTFTNK